MNDAPQIPQDILDRATTDLMRNGWRVFQSARLAPTDEGHVSALLRHMAPPHGAVIADIGCGIGEPARLMHQERPDLDFILVNQNRLQLSHAPAIFRCHLADMHALPIETASVDGVMFLYSLCHSAFGVALREAARIVRPGGFLFVYDFERQRGTNDLFLAKLCARAISSEQLIRVAACQGWRPLMHEMLEADDSAFRDSYPSRAEFDLIFGDLAVAVWKMVRDTDASAPGGMLGDLGIVPAVIF